MKNELISKDMDSPDDFRTVLPIDGPWCFAYSNVPMEKVISSEKDLRASGLKIYPATVPGNFELDLVREGKLPDPFVGTNVLLLRDLESCHVWYCCRFAAPPIGDRKAIIVFEGVDCFSEIYLNGNHLGSTDNMLVEHEFDVSQKLLPTNELLVHILPSREFAACKDYPVGVGAPSTHMESLYVRKAPHMYGWDIMPRAISAGIWRPVKLQIVPKCHIDYVYLYTTGIEPGFSRAHMCLKYSINGMPNTPCDYVLHIEGACGNQVFRESVPVVFKAGMHRFAIKEPALWWPSGYGDPALYNVQVTLLAGDNPVDAVSFKTGVRTVKLERTSVTDENGNGEFCFIVNGERIFARGSNWVPLDAFHSRDTSRMQDALQLVKESHCNILRCWGGNVYENNDFFDWCDAHGIMVWQDFAMACMVYPQDIGFQETLEREVRRVIRRLRQHPCLILWSGDNECDWAYEWYRLGNPNANVLTRKVIPQVLREEDPLRPYLPSSPYIDEKAYKAGEKYLTEHHLWGPRDYYKSEFYRKALCHFASEIGYHGCPEPRSIQRFISPGRVWPWSENFEWDLHSTNPFPEMDVFFPAYHRVELMVNQIRSMFGKVPDDLETFALASQIVQAEALKTFIESFRSSKWRRTGIIWWNLLDGWPQFSDAVVDYYFTKKLAFYYIERCQKPVALMIAETQPMKLALVAANDTRRDIKTRYKVYDVDTRTVLVEGEGVAKPNASTEFASLRVADEKAAFLMLEWTESDQTHENHYLLGQPPFDISQYARWLLEANLCPEQGFHKTVCRRLGGEQ